MTEEVKANRNESCSFLQITERLDKIEHLLDYAQCVAKDFPDPDHKKMTADGHAHMLEVRQHQLTQTLTHASSLLSRIVTEYERFVRVRFAGSQDGHEDVIFVCRECVDCGIEEPGVRLALDPYACGLRTAGSYEEIMFRVKIAIADLSKMLNIAHELGCEEPELWYGSVRNRIIKWGKEGYHHSLKDLETGRDDDDAK